MVSFSSIKILNLNTRILLDKPSNCTFFAVAQMSRDLVKILVYAFNIFICALSWADVLDWCGQGFHAGHVNKIQDL